MACEHLIKKPTRRVIEGGVEIVYLQCQTCGSGRAGKKSDYNVPELPQYDVLLRERYESEQREAWQRNRMQQIYEQVNKCGPWWEKYNQYLNSPHWKKIRAVVLRRDQFCQRCLINPAAQAHHLSYATYDKHGFSVANECVGLCFECHDAMHESPMS